MLRRINHRVTNQKEGEQLGEAVSVIQSKDAEESSWGGELNLGGPPEGAVGNRGGAAPDSDKEILKEGIGEYQRTVSLCNLTPYCSGCFGQVQKKSKI